jgi:hypothetical protein
MIVQLIFSNSLEENSKWPRREKKRTASASLRCTELVFDSDLARVKRPAADIVSFIRRHVYKPEHSTTAMARAA